MEELKFYGWTDFDNYNYLDFEKENFPNLSMDQLMELSEKIRHVVVDHIREKGIKFDGGYHQNGDDGCPLVQVGNKIVRETCTFRFWGGIIADAGYGESYIDWAWSDAEDPVYPHCVKGENIIVREDLYKKNDNL